MMEVRREFIVLGVVFFAIVIGLGMIFSGGESKTAKLEAQEKKVTKELEAAKEKYETESAKFDDMMSSLRSAFPLAAATGDSYSGMKSVVQNTNALFEDPNGSNPNFKLKTPEKTRQRINEMRAEINRKLNEAEQISYRNDASRTTILAAKKEAEEIKSYINVLKEAVQNLTPENSGLTEKEIAEYKSVPDTAAQEVNNVIASLGQASSQSQSTTQTASQQGTTPVPVPTQEQIIAQQNTVNQAQSEVSNLENELSNIQDQLAQQNQNTSGPTTASTTTQDGTWTNNGTSEETTTGSSQDYQTAPQFDQSGDYFYRRPLTDDPKLLQGSN